MLFQRRNFLALSLAGFATRAHGQAPLTRKAGLVLFTGNSHSIGWAERQPQDVFSSRVMQFTQNGKLLQIDGGILDAGDRNALFGKESVGPSLNFLNGLAAARTDLDVIVGVAVGKGGSGFLMDEWKPAGAGRGNLLSVAIRRWNSAQAALRSAGYAVEPIAAIHMSARPDVNVSDLAQVTDRATRYATDIDDYVDLLRSRLKGVPDDFPVIVSCAMTLQQVMKQNEAAMTFLSSANGIAWRKKYCWFVDTINDWGEGEAKNLPIKPFDGTHANRDGVLTEGRLLLSALQQARGNADVRVPFSRFPDQNKLSNLYDFRTGSLLDMAGNANLKQAGLAPDVIGFTKHFGTYAFRRFVAGGSGFVCPVSLQKPFSIVIRLAQLEPGRSQVLLKGEGQSTGPLLVIEGGNLVARGHQKPVRKNIASKGEGPFTVVLSFDGSKVSLFLDGVSAGSAPARFDGMTSLKIFPGSATGESDFLGAAQYVAIFADVISPSLVAAISTADFTPRTG